MHILKKTTLIFSHSLIFLTIFTLAGCAGTLTDIREWNPSEEKFFDDGIDIIEDNSKLSGQWAFDAEEELNGRANLADVIAIVTIVAVQTNNNISEVDEKRIEVKIDKLLYGKVKQKHIVLTSRSRTKGYTLINRYEKNLKGRHLLFLRRFKTETEIDNHFHLSSASSKMEEKVTAIIKKRVKAESEPVQ